MTGITRRSFLTTAAAASGAVLGLPGLWRPAQAQTTLRLALGSHSVPGADEAMQQLLAEWGKANHVQVQADFDNGRSSGRCGRSPQSDRTRHRHLWVVLPIYTRRSSNR